MNINITNPSKQTDKLGQSYTSYMVNLSTTKTNFTCKNSSVIRRFRDFCWLETELTKAYAGVIIPPLPEKQTLGRFDEEFIESRRRSLEKFLIRISQHDDLCNSVHFITFLQGEDSEMLKAKDDTKTTTSSKILKSSIGWVSGVSTTLQNSGKLVEIDKTIDDVRIEEITVYTNLIDKSIRNVSKYCQQISLRDKEMTKTLRDLSSSLNAYSQNESVELSTCVLQAGIHMENIANYSHELATTERHYFDEEIDEYVRYVESLQDALKRRESKRHLHITLLTDLQLKEHSYNKALNSGKDSDVSAKKEKYDHAQNASDRAKRELDEISFTLINEFDMFKERKTLDIKRIMLKYCTCNIDFIKKKESELKLMMPCFEVPPGSADDKRSSFKWGETTTTSSTSTGGSNSNVTTGVSNINISSNSSQSNTTSVPSLPSTPNPFYAEDDDDSHTEV